MTAGSPPDAAPEQAFHYVVYVSSATHMLTQEGLDGLLRECRENNQRAGITGMLLYRDGDFMQLIEGPRDAVRALEKRIAADPRHKRMTVLLQGAESRRLFADWSMAFRDLRNLPDGDREGFSSFLNEPFTADWFGQDPHRALKLLLTFREHMG